MPNSMSILISTGCLWRPLALASLHMRNWINGHPGILMEHGVDGYYLGPALDHYRCYQAHITRTKGTRIVDTVEMFPFENSDATNILKISGQHCSLRTVQCPSKPSPCCAFHSHWNSANFQRYYQRPSHQQLHNMPPP
jgi:hypothetical protein